jgi:hypothetical protein
MNNPIAEWLANHSEVSALLAGIDQSGLNAEEAARKAFYDLSDHLNIPKHPADITELHYQEHEELGIKPRSVFVEQAILNYLEPKDEIRGRTLCSIYNVYHKTYIDWAEITKRQFEKIRRPEFYMAYIFGKDIDANIRFSIDGESWIKAGAVIAVKIYPDS